MIVWTYQHNFVCGYHIFNANIVRDEKDHHAVVYSFKKCGGGGVLGQARLMLIVYQSGECVYLPPKLDKQ